MALQFTYELTDLGSSRRIMIQHGPDLGKFSDQLRFGLIRLARLDGYLPRVICQRSGEFLAEGAQVVVDAERGLTYCVNCANLEVAGNIVTCRPS